MQLGRREKESVLNDCKSWTGLKNVQMAAYGHHFRAGYRQVSSLVNSTSLSVTILQGRH
jgi:hypothetical protein